MTCHNLQSIIAAALLLGASGCMSVQAESAQLDDEEATVADAEPTRIALRKGAAAAGADEIDGYSDNGVGVYLSAANDTAELTLYVVAPAESATFEQPALHLTVQQGETQTTQDSEFETITLLAGESHVFSRRVDGALMGVVAEVAAQ